MTVSYNCLWKLLVDKKMSKSDLRKISVLTIININLYKMKERA